MIINFRDFRHYVMENNKRIYYYNNDNIVNLYFLLDGTIIKSFVDVDLLENSEKFFSDQIFVGATRLLFNIPLLPEGSVSPGDALPTIISDIEASDIIQDNRSAEGDNIDIQKTGVGER